MEYSANGGISWTTCTGTEVTGLTPGAYIVRVASTGKSFVSPPVRVTVAAHSGGGGGGTTGGGGGGGCNAGVGVVGMLALLWVTLGEKKK
jgi:hypothetical protein